MNFSITPSHIIEYLFCPRYTYYEYVLRIPQYEEKYYKVLRGREMHQLKAKRNMDYHRQRIGVVEKYLYPYLTNDLLRGEVDEVLVLKDETMAPLDYKFAAYKDKIFDTYKTQLYCYAWLIQSNYNVEVKRGFLVYTRSKNKLIEVPIEKKDYEKIKNAAVHIQAIIGINKYPKATRYKRRCVSCTYRNICIK